MPQSTPVLSHIFETDLGILGWVTLQGRVGITVACFTRDLDMTDLKQWTMQLSQRIRFLSPKVLLRITASTEISHQTEFSDFSRHGAVEKIGYTRHKLLLTLQTPASLSPQRVFRYVAGKMLGLSEESNNFLGESKLLLEQLSALDLGTLGLAPRSLAKEEIEDLFKPSLQNAVPTPYGVDLGDEVVGVVKLTELLSEGVPFHFIALIRESIPKPYEIIFSVKTRGSDVGFQLEQFESNAKGMPSAKASEKLSKISDAKNRYDHRETFLDLELSILLRRSTDQILRPDLGKVTRILSGLGKVSLETYGGFSSWKATLAGATQHMKLMETEGAFSALAPLLTRGNSFEANELKKGTLALHRLDGSVYCYHPFGKKKNNANAIIVGPPNSGKSSLLTLKTMALAHDPNQIFIKGDVGGSYLSECRKLGGVMYNIGMNSHSGIRTFEVISDLPHDLYICSTLSGFLQTFIQERILRNQFSLIPTQGLEKLRLITF